MFSVFSKICDIFDPWFAKSAHGSLPDKHTWLNQYQYLMSDRVWWIGIKVTGIIDSSEQTLKFSCETASELSTSASIDSSSRSIKSIFSRICCNAASEHRDAKSDPTWPCVSAATYTDVTDDYMYYINTAAGVE